MPIKYRFQIRIIPASRHEYDPTPVALFLLVVRLSPLVTLCIMHGVAVSSNCATTHPVGNYLLSTQITTDRGAFHLMGEPIIAFTRDLWVDVGE